MLEWVTAAALPALVGEFHRRLERLVEAAATPCPIALTGGQSAAAFYDGWAARGVAAKLQFYWSDERMVALDDPDSNFKLASDRFLNPCQVPPTRLHAAPTTLPPAECASAYAEQIRRTVPPGTGGNPSFPLIILGLGADGHTGSLFPGRNPYFDDQLLVRAVDGTAVHPHARVTFTPRLINAAEQVWIVVTGASKAWAVSQLAERSATVEQVPVLAVDPQLTQVTVFADAASSSGAR